MTEKELIRKAITEKADDPLRHTAADIISHEGRGAQAHIRKRRFTFITVTAAAALVIGAGVLTFQKLAERDFGIPAARSDESSISEYHNSRTHKVEKLCDYTGITEGQGNTITKTPSNLPDYQVRIEDRAVTLIKNEGEDKINLLGQEDYNAVIKVYSADVTDDGKADICIEAKPSFESEDSLVYMYDVADTFTKQIYYVPNYMSFTLKDEEDKLLLGMKSINDDRYEYMTARYTIPEKYNEAKLLFFERARERFLNDLSYSSVEYSDDDGNGGMDFLANGLYYYSARSLSKESMKGDKDLYANAERVLSIFGKEGEAAPLQPYEQPEPIGRSVTGEEYILGNSYSEYLALSCAGGDPESGEADEIGVLSLYKSVSGEICVYVYTKDIYGKRCGYCYKLSEDKAAGIVLRDLMPDDADSIIQDNSYYCADETGLYKTSAAHRMIAPQDGAYAIAYHFDRRDDGLYFIIDSIQLPKDTEFTDGELSLYPSSELTDYGDPVRLKWDTLASADGKREFKVTELDKFGEDTTLNLQSTLQTSSTDRRYYIYDCYSFGGTYFDKEFSYLADFTASNAVTRLSDGSQIRFDRYSDVFPDVTISMTDSAVTVTDDSGTKTIVSDVNVLRAFADDLNGDGYPEVIVESSKLDPKTDGTVTVYDLVSAELSVADEGGAYLDAGREYLAVCRYDYEKPADGRIVSPNGRSLKKYYGIWSSDAFTGHIREEAEKLQDICDNDPDWADRIGFRFNSYTDDARINVVLEGRCLEISDILQEIFKVLDEKTYDVRVFDKDEWGIFSGETGCFYYISSTEDDGSGNEYQQVKDKFMILYNSDDNSYYIICTESDYSDWEDGTIAMKLPESSNEVLSFIDPKDPKFKDVSFDGGDNFTDSLLYDLEVSKKHPTADFGFISQYGEIEVGGTIGVSDIGSVEMNIEKADTADNVSVEKVDISLDIQKEGSAGSYGWSNDTLEIGTFGIGETNVIDLNDYFSLLIDIRIKLKMPDGSSRVVQRSISVYRGDD